MKSEKAEMYLENNSGFTCPDIYLSNAKIAVEIAEEDALGRAINALQNSCPFYDAGQNICWKDDYAKMCDKVCMNTFLKYYNNER